MPAFAEEDVYTLAIARFTARSVPPYFELFLSSLPRLISAELKNLPPRYMDKAVLAKKKNEQEIAKIFSAGEDLSRCLDELALRSLEVSTDQDKRRQNILDAQKNVELASEKIPGIGKGTKGSPPKAEAQKTTENAPIPSALWEENRKGFLFEVKGEENLSSTLKAQSIDLLIEGSVQFIGDYASITVIAYDPSLDKEVYRWKDYASPTDPGPLARDFADRITEYVAGRTFARVDFEVSPSSSSIRVNERTLDPSESRLFIFEPSKLDIFASASDRGSYEVSLDVSPGDRKVVKFELPEYSTGVASITTSPAGLPVFIDGIRIGVAPLSYSLTGRRSIASVFGEGGSSAEVVLPAQGNLNLALSPRIKSVDTASSQKAKDDFYGALGYFVLSLPSTTISYAMTSLYYEAWEASGRQSSLQTKLIVSSVALSAFSATSVFFATKAVIRFIAYLSASQ